MGHHGISAAHANSQLLSRTLFNSTVSLGIASDSFAEDLISMTLEPRCFFLA